MTRVSTKISTIHAELRKEIAGGRWKAGDKLPTDAEFAQHFGCSAGTINKAMASLAHEGFVERKTGSGTHMIRTTVDSWSPPAQLDAFAFIYPGEQHESIWRTVRGFQDAAMEKQRRIVTLSTGLDFQKELEIMKRLTEFNVLGAVVYPTAFSLHDHVHLMKILVESEFPIVITNYPPPGLDLPVAHGDCFHAGWMTTRHLLGRGLKKIGFFSNDSASTSMRSRYRGYRWALEEAGITPERDWIFLDPAMHPDFVDPLREPTIQARAYLQQLQGSLEGVVCAVDFLAVALMEEASKNGILIPDDLKVISIGDGVAPPSHLPGLTAYRAPDHAVGRAAFGLLDALINKTPIADREIICRGEMIIRDSA